MIHLWVDGEGWREFELTDTAELEKRNITIGDRASIGYGSSIGNRASIGNDVSIGNRASIGDDAKPIIIYIRGSKHPVSYWGADSISIGCQHHSTDQWVKHGKAIGRANDYTEEQISEYLGYIELIKAKHDRHGPTAGTEKYKAGDKVKIKPEEWIASQHKDAAGNIRLGPSFAKDMFKYAGKEAVIAGYIDPNRYHLDIDGGGFTWCREFFEEENLGRRL
jgi:hypothetical protein